MKTTNIYVLIDPRTDEVRYVGKTTNIKKRYNKHINESKNSTKSHKKAWINGLLKQDLLPKIEIIDIVLIDEWQFWEKYWISQMKMWGFNLANHTNGGDGVSTGFIPWNKGTKGIMKSNNTSFTVGNTIGIETRIKKGERISIDTEFKGGNIPWNKGLECSDETKNKISKANKGKESKNKKRINQYSLDMELIETYDSVTTASKVTGINQTSIAMVARGERNKAGNYKWIYE